MAIENSFIILFCIATVVSILVRRLSLPYTVALVLTGLGLGALHALTVPHLTKDLLFTIFLPGLLFEAAFHLEWAQFRKNLLAIGALAVPGVVVAILVTAAIATSVVRGLALDAGFTWTYGLIFAALVAATDPIAVIALFRTMSVPHRLSVLVEGESLLNDGTTIVFLTLILSFVSGEKASAGDLVAGFLTITGGGALVGLVIGTAASQVTKRIDDAMIEITLTVVAAYGSFVLAEHLHMSGVIATVAAGLVCGSYGREVGMSPSTRLAVETFWEYVAFALNSVVFLLIGFEVHFSALAASWREIVVAFVAVIAARLLVTTAVSALLSRTREQIPRPWIPVIAWGGLRGALSMVLALGLPDDLPHRDLLITMTVGVVLASILVQGLTMSPLLRKLGLVANVGDELAYDQARGELRVTSEALEELALMGKRQAAPTAMLQKMRTTYERRRDLAEAALQEVQVQQAGVRRMHGVRSTRHLLALERDRISEAHREGVLGREAFARLSRNVSARLVKLDAGEFTEPDELLESRLFVREPQPDGGAEPPA
jgi:Na+:H+ antiporter